ncbi:hypothetical protein Tco_1189373, partial [Tanacetum coccineum]
NDGNEVGQNAVQNPGIQNVENINGLSVVSEIANQYGNGNVIAQEEEAGIQSTQEEFEFMAAADAYEETERVKVNCTSEDTLQQASHLELNLTMLSSMTQMDQLRINPFKISRVDNVVPNKPFKTSIRIKPITVSQPNVIHKQQANFDSNRFSSTRVNNTAKTRIPHPRSNSNTDRVSSKSKSSCLSNNVEKIEENHRNSKIPKNQNHMSSECNNIMLTIRNA